MADSATTRKVVTKLFADVQSGNVEGVLDALSPSIVFALPGNKFNTVVPNLKTWRGKDGVIEAFRLRSLWTDVTDFEQREMIVEDDRAFVINWQSIRHKATGMEADFEFSMVLTVGDDGLITHWKAFFDSSPEVAIFRSDINERMISEVLAGAADKVAELVAQGANPSHRDPGTGLTALMIAAGRGDVTTVRTLIEAGADVLSADSGGGATALHKACQGGSLAVVKALVEAGAFVDCVAATTGHTPLMDALWFKFPAIVEYLLGQGAGLQLSTHYGFPLKEHFDYELNVNAIGKDRLLEAERHIKERQRRDEEAMAGQRLMDAVTKGDVELVKQFIAEGAEVDERFPVVNGFNDRHTPLLVAARDGHTEIARLLLTAGADVNAVEPTFGAVPLHKAVYNGHQELTRLIATWPGVDLNFQGATNGYAPLHDAIWHGYHECARILVTAGAGLDLVGHDGKTPLDLAIEINGADHTFTQFISAAGAQ
ncbi:ankyrin repeat domain-containing protein [Nonomuraea sp. NBC_00507]|uniref:ankyrin repeat domain-containing protein n=1 Tax=Nonomuraea sp. NBC_00507 TaxID=2976002 RepID=UPI002E16B92B